MERLENYEFITPRRKLSQERSQARKAFVVKLCDGHIWKFNKSEYPQTSTNTTARAVSIMIKNTVAKIHPRYKVECEIDGDFIIMRVNRYGG
jgi:hypothetical protein